MRGCYAEINIISLQRIVGIRQRALGHQIRHPLGIGSGGQRDLCRIGRRANINDGVVYKLRQGRNVGRRVLTGNSEQPLDRSNGFRVVADKGGDLVAAEWGRVSHQNDSGSTRASSRAIAICAALVPLNFCSRQLRMLPCCSQTMRLLYCPIVPTRAAFSTL